MLLTLVRMNESPEETTGVLLIDGHPYCGTLEPPVVPNARHPKGAIPLGWYRMTLAYSSVYGRILPLLHMVPNFDQVRIHAGNNKDHTNGSILVGKLSGKLLFYSLTTERQLVSKLMEMPREEFYLEVTTPERYFVEHDRYVKLPRCRYLLKY